MRRVGPSRSLSVTYASYDSLFPRDPRRNFGSGRAVRPERTSQPRRRMSAFGKQTEHSADIAERPSLDPFRTSAAYRRLTGCTIVPSPADYSPSISVSCYGVGHNEWHQGFYSKLKRNDGQGSCCNLMDCRPTQSRMVGDHYEVKVDGVWTPVPYDKINNAVAPDGGAHVCAPRQVGPNKGVIFCVILPLEG
jgi:hypothetical protein